MQVADIIKAEGWLEKVLLGLVNPNPAPLDPNPNP